MWIFVVPMWVKTGVVAAVVLAVVVAAVVAVEEEEEQPWEPEEMKPRTGVFAVAPVWQVRVTHCQWE
jgi:hypothetical protein